MNRSARLISAAVVIMTALTAASVTAPRSYADSTYPETTGGVAHTWSNYTNAGGLEGPTIPSHQTVRIECKLHGFRVQNGNDWWYKIASSPWNGAYFVSADAFYNNGHTDGDLRGTPWVDPQVHDCGSTSRETAQTKSRTSQTADHSAAGRRRTETP